MPTPVLLVGPSTVRLRGEAFDRTAEHATSDVESVLLIEGNDSQHDAHRDHWNDAHDPSS